jgi:hypothetical protein
MYHVHVIYVDCALALLRLATKGGISANKEQLLAMLFYPT